MLGGDIKISELYQEGREGGRLSGIYSQFPHRTEENPVDQLQILFFFFSLDERRNKTYLFLKFLQSLEV